MAYKLEVTLTKRDPNRLVREYRYSDIAETLDIATTTADGLIARMATFDGQYRREKHLMNTRNGKVTGLSVVYWSTVDSIVVGYANITEIN